MGFVIPLKILILKPSSLGDIVHALPVLRLLKANGPADSIYWWVSLEFAELLRDDPDLSGVFLFDRRRWSAPWHWTEAARSIAEIRGHRFDLVIDLQGLARSGLVAWLARATFTVGVEDWREGAPAFYDLAVPRPAPNAHAVDWYLAVLAALNVPVHWNFTWFPKRPQAAEQVRARWQTSRARWLLLCPGARWANKRWPLEHYAQLLRKLARAHPGFNFGILGSRADTELGAALAKGNSERVVDLTGQTSLSQMIEWIRLSELMVTNDSGPMHIAAALGKPVVPIFGPTDPRRTGPYGQIERSIQIELPCVPCLKPRCHYVQPMECLRAIHPDRVAAQVAELLPVE